VTGKFYNNYQIIACDKNVKGVKLRLWLQLKNI
jgi:hypothetical protein